MRCPQKQSGQDDTASTLLIRRSELARRKPGDRALSELTQKTKIVIGAALVVVFLLGVIFGQTVGSGRASFVCPLVPSVYQQQP